MTFCFLQLVLAVVYIYLITKKKLRPVVFSQVFIREMILPFFLTFALVFLSAKLSFFEENRWLDFLCIGLLGGLVLIITGLVIFPFRDMKAEIVKLKQRI